MAVQVGTRVRSVAYSERNVSAYGGVRLIAEMLEKIGFRAMIDRHRLPDRGSNRSYDPHAVIEAFVVAGMLGTSRLNHIEMIRHDEVIRSAMGWRAVPSASTCSRFLSKMKPEDVVALRLEYLNRWFGKMKMPKATLDVDSTVITRYGEQEHASKGYNPTKPGRSSHHPLIAFLAEADMVANVRLRPGASSSSTDAAQFIKESIELVGNDRIGLVRADKGFYSADIIETITAQGVDFVVAAKLTTALQRELSSIDTWRSSHACPGISYGELVYQPQGWSKAHRFVVERHDMDEKSYRGGMLFEPDDLGKAYSYRVYLTSLRITAELVAGIYRQRANAENQIKQLKNDFGMNGYGLHKASACEMMMVMTAIAYNVVSLCISLSYDKRNRPQLRRFVLECIALGSWVRTKARKTELVLSIQGKNRLLFAERLKTLERITTPVPLNHAS